MPVVESLTYSVLAPLESAEDQENVIPLATPGVLRIRDSLPPPEYSVCASPHEPVLPVR